MSSDLDNLLEGLHVLLHAVVGPQVGDKVAGVHAVEAVEQGVHAGVQVDEVHLRDVSWKWTGSDGLDQEMRRIEVQKNRLDPERAWLGGLISSTEQSHPENPSTATHHLTWGLQVPGCQTAEDVEELVEVLLPGLGDGGQQGDQDQQPSDEQHHI